MNYETITTCDVCNGTGLGVVLWVSGCDIHCNGCHNKGTWDFNHGDTWGIYSNQVLMQELSKPYITRFTLSGGHPLAPQNITACTALCKEIKKKFPNKSIWLYTGYTWEDIKDFTILKYVDILVDGAYNESMRDITLPFRGSTNQRIIDVQKSIKNNTLIEVQDEFLQD